MGCYHYAAKMRFLTKISAAYFFLENWRGRKRQKRGCTLFEIDIIGGLPA